MGYTTEELGLRKGFEEFIRRHGKELLLKEWDWKILSLNNPSLSAFFAKLGGEHAKEHADIVLKSGNIEGIFELSEIYPEHFDYILNCDDTYSFEYNFCWVKRLFQQAKNEKSSNNRKEIGKRISKHIEAISKSFEFDKLLSFLDWYYIKISAYEQYKFLGLSLLGETDKYINDIINNISESSDAEVLYGAFKVQMALLSFINNNSALDSTYKHNNKLRDAIIKTGNAEYNYNIVNWYSCSDDYLKKHEEVVINSGDVVYNYYFAFSIKNADILKHKNVILKSKDPKYNYLFARDIVGTNKAEHLKVIAESKDVKYNYLACLLGVDTDALNRLVVLESKDVKYCFELASRFPNDLFFDEYIDVIKTSGNEEYIAKLPELKSFMIADINDKIKKLNKING